MGARSWGPVRGAIYGGGDYFRESNDEIALMVMIETAEAVRNVRAIIATEGIDGCYIGPNDLSISYGVRRAAIWASRWPRRSRRRWRPSSPPARRWGKRPVIHVYNAVAANRRLRQGFRFVSVNNELGIMRGAVAAEFQAIER
jgi:4-hydroxy-2-oxoheptanedioate aldolase